MQHLVRRLADELSIRPQQVESTICLLDNGATVPFIARYRKQVTGSLGNILLRRLSNRLKNLRRLERRRQVIIKSVQQQDKLDAALKQKLNDAETKYQLEDLYLPFKPKPNSKAQLAIAAGLKPLADSLFQDPSQHPQTLAQHYINSDKGINNVENALEGAQCILMQHFAENDVVRGKIRFYFQENAVITARVVGGKELSGYQFSNYFNFCESFQRIPAHQALELLRGRNLGFLQLAVIATDAETKTGNNDSNLRSPCVDIIARHLDIVHKQRAADDWLAIVVRESWDTLLQPALETELFEQLRERADEASIKFIANNLKTLLMAAPAGKKVTMGLDPGLKTGVKVVVIDETGKLLKFTTIFPHLPQQAWQQSLTKLKQLCLEHCVTLLSIGNGKGYRETDKLTLELIASIEDQNIHKRLVNDAGADIYSTSEIAAREFPELEVCYRRAVSIARRLQDPLAELIKVNPKTLAVGQYRHNVNQYKLSSSLDAVVEDCVNAVGIDLNTASASLLRHVSGLNPSLATTVVNYRVLHGRFVNRQQLLQVPNLAATTFEQAAGFLKIVDGENPLDDSIVHPEAYPLLDEIVRRESLLIEDLRGNTTVLKKLDAKPYMSDRFSLATVTEILTQLAKPRRDPRPPFNTTMFINGIEAVKDLCPNMQLQGIITNLTKFGAFVDIGVGQDGLIHISMLSDDFVCAPAALVETGEVVTVKVIEVDIKRNRVSLSMRSQPVTPTTHKMKHSTLSQKSKNLGVKKPAKPKVVSAFAAALTAAISSNDDKN